MPDALWRGVKWVEGSGLCVLAPTPVKNLVSCGFQGSGQKMLPYATPPIKVEFHCRHMATSVCFLALWFCFGPNVDGCYLQCQAVLVLIRLLSSSPSPCCCS